MTINLQRIFVNKAGTVGQYMDQNYLTVYILIKTGDNMP